VYREDGLLVQAYHPSFNITQSSLEDSHSVSGWGANSLQLWRQQYLYSAMNKEQWERGPSVEILRTIQGHCNVVLEHLQQWDGYDRACERIYLITA